MSFYFDKFEQRKPPDPLPYSMTQELLYQFLATVTLVIGAWYIWWRWTSSLNYDALWFSIPLALAETCAYIGLVLFSANLWKTQDYPQQPPPEFLSQTLDYELSEDRPLTIDVFLPTYNEEEELVKLSIRDAKKLEYPFPIDIKIHILDDGKRATMRQLAAEEGVNYITRDNNMGFKAGNMRNAMEHTGGDFIVICDADTRVFPTLLKNTLGYFRDPQVAWVQTPQWFFDLPEGKNLRWVLKKYLWYPGFAAGWMLEKLCGPILIGKDPFVNDPQMFYDVIQRRRNWANASFCCGAGSIHRREAVMESALKSYAKNIDKAIDEVMVEISKAMPKISKSLGKKDSDLRLKERIREVATTEIIHEIEMTPYKFHVSEDIYTSIVLHSDSERHWKSVLHPGIECKMLSPQDLQTWTVQRFKYAGGSLDICLNDNPVFQKGLDWKQRLMYMTTFWSYFGGVWNTLFLISPIIFLFTQISPVSAYSIDFYKHILPFLVLNELTTMVGLWGLAGFQSKASYLSFFAVNLRALWTVLRGKQIKFPTTPKSRQEGNFFHLVIPQFTVIVLTLLGIAYAGYDCYYNSHFINLNGLLTNAFWGINNIAAMSGLVMAAFWQPDDKDNQKKKVLIKSLCNYFIIPLVLITLLLKTYPTISELYGGILKNDPDFSFLYEGTYNHSQKIVKNILIEFVLVTALYYGFFSVLKKGHYRHLLALLPILLFFFFYDFYFISFGKVFKVCDVSELPELIDVLPLYQIAGYFSIILTVIVLYYFNLTNNWRLYLFPIAMFLFISCVITFQPTWYLKLFNRHAKYPATIWSDERTAQNGYLTTLLYFEATMSNTRKQSLRLYGDGVAYETKQADLMAFLKKNNHRNVHIIMLESFFNPALFSKIHYSHNPYAQAFNDLIKTNESTVISPVFGGYTAQAEFEVLCGVPAFHKYDSIEFNTFTGKNVFCLPEYLKNSGYRVVASNSYKPEFFNTIKAYQGLGFSEVYFPKQYAPKTDTYLSLPDKTQYLFDGDLFQQNLNFVKQHLQEKNPKPLFNYVLGVYGHFPFYLDNKRHPNHIKATGSNQVLNDEYQRATNQIYYRTEALAHYINQLTLIDPNSIIIAMGDHVPKLGGMAFYNQMSFRNNGYDAYHKPSIFYFIKGQSIKKPEQHQYDVINTLLDYVTDNRFCKKVICNRSNAILNYQYDMIMAKASQ